MLRIMQLESSHVRILEPLLLEYEYKPYRHYFTGSDRSQLNRYFLKKVGSLISDERAENLVATRNGKIIGLISWAESLWDSRQLRIKMARVNQLMVQEYIPNASVIKELLFAVIEKCKVRNIKYLFHRLDADDLLTLEILENAEFQLQDVIVNFSFNLGASRISPSRYTPIVVNPYRTKDLSSLREIAGTSFIYDRFHSDPRINKERASQLHAAWISNACRGLADVVLVAKLNKKVVGFVSCKIDKLTKKYLPVNFGTIDLIAVDKDVRGEGIGEALLRKAMDWFSGKVDMIEVGTQVRNYPALRLYQKLGFRIVSANFSLRKWFG